MPKWIHDRARHLMEKNPSMPESQAWAVATQQSHAGGHSPEGYGTPEGREEAKKKYKTPGDDEQRAAPGEKTAGLVNRMEQWIGNAAREGVRRDLQPLVTKAKRYGAIGAVGGTGLVSLDVAAHHRTDQRLKEIEQKMSPKTKTAGISTPFSLALVGGFCNEFTAILEKTSSGLLPPPSTALGQVKSTTPKPATSVRGHTAVAKVHSTPPMSPSQGHQPVANAPQVRT